MEKKERYETRKLFDQQLSEHYLIRNVFLHGHTIPRSEKEDDLNLIATLSENGYAPELYPRDGSPPKLYPELLIELASDRVAALHTIGTEIVYFVQNVVNSGAAWIAHHKLPGQTSGVADA